MRIRIGEEGDIQFHSSFKAGSPGSSCDALHISQQLLLAVNEDRSANTFRDESQIDSVPPWTGQSLANRRLGQQAIHGSTPQQFDPRAGPQRPALAANTVAAGLLSVNREERLIGCTRCTQ